jgi:hypothetical protein
MTIAGNFFPNLLMWTLEVEAVSTLSISTSTSTVPPAKPKSNTSHGHCSQWCSPPVAASDPPSLVPPLPTGPSPAMDDEAIVFTSTPLCPISGGLGCNLCIRVSRATLPSTGCNPRPSMSPNTRSNYPRGGPEWSFRGVCLVFHYCGMR